MNVFIVSVIVSIALYLIYCNLVTELRKRRRRARRSIEVHIRAIESDSGYRFADLKVYEALRLCRQYHISLLEFGYNEDSLRDKAVWSLERYIANCRRIRSECLRKRQELETSGIQTKDNMAEWLSIKTGFSQSRQAVKIAIGRIRLLRGAS